MSLRFAVLEFVLVLAIAASTMCQDPASHLLWPAGAPGALGDEQKDKPRAIVYLPDTKTANGAAILICPGGGYGHLAMGHEGHDIARWLNSFGVAGIVLDYRHRGRGYGHPAPLQDAQRGIRLARNNHKKWNIDRNRIGIMGFSAGGHLASSVATHFDKGSANAPDPIDRESCRPDFLVLCYPVIAFNEPYTHGGSQRNLLGPNASEKLASSLSSEKQVTRRSPPAFLWHTTEDSVVPAENSIQFYLAMKRADIPVELHVFEKGRHGLGLAKKTAGTSAWPDRCREWLQVRGIIPGD